MTVPSQVGGYPGTDATPAPLDSDNDGMPDSWEDTYGLNNTVDDSSGDFNGDGYTNIEDYINSFFTEPPAPPEPPPDGPEYCLGDYNER